MVENLPGSISSNSSFSPVDWMVESFVPVVWAFDSLICVVHMRDSSFESFEEWTAEFRQTSSSCLLELSLESSEDGEVDIYIYLNPYQFRL